MRDDETGAAAAHVFFFYHAFFSSVFFSFSSVLGHRKRRRQGEALMQRADDTEAALAQRLEGYHAQTVPILEHYASTLTPRPSFPRSFLKAHRSF